MSAHRIRQRLLRLLGVTAVALAVLAAAPAANGTRAHEARSAVKQLKLYYEANGGRRRFAYLVLPSWYEPARNPPLPLVIAPHGAGPGPFLALTRVWGDLASRGPFAVVIPQGQGRELTHYSYGYAGQVGDLARMPAIVREAVPWLRIDPRRIYAVGGSMGGQEILLLIARYPGLLAGAAAFDAPTDLPLRYEQFADVKGTEYRRTLVRDEIGAAPAEDPRAYAERSPITFVPAIAASQVPLQLWWSTRDELVIDGRLHSGRLFREIRRLNPGAPVREIVGTWRHGASMRWNRRLPGALRLLGLLPGSGRGR